MTCFSGFMLFVSALGAWSVPVDTQTLENLYDERAHKSVRNLFSVTQLQSLIQQDGGEIVVDASEVSALLDGTAVDPERIYGKVYIGPYPFEEAETAFAYKRFRRSALVERGRAVLPLGYLFGAETNSEGWEDRGQVAVRLDLYEAREGQDRHLGVYDTFVRFQRVNAFVLVPTIVEGPYVHLVRSENPDQVTIAFVTSTAVHAAVELGDGRRIDAGEGTEFEVGICGLEPDRHYAYTVDLGDGPTPTYSFKTAPKLGEGRVVMAYTGDSREGIGGGMLEHRGLNYATLQRLAALAFINGAQVFLMGGDLVNGYTTVKEDFEGQLRAWKQAMSGFWHERPVYPALGNHESLLRVFDNDEGLRLEFDRWPYETQSAEAVFADVFVNPTNGPETSDARRPTYRESVYSFHYGPVKAIAFNNNYWVSYAAEAFGGCPEGYVLRDQLDWIKAELEKAEADPRVKYILLYAQEPVFPNGGHTEDAMWYDGDNSIRAHHFEEDDLVAEKKGILEIRNEFVRAVAASTKVAAVLGSDEHAYHRVLIDKRVPVGIPSTDDQDKDGQIEVGEEPVSPLVDLAHGVWYVTSGGGGAPYYSECDTPWNLWWRQQPDPETGFYFSSQENVVILEAHEDGMSMTALNPNGEVIDHIGNLMAAK